jgi:hypothetical protein
VLERIESGAQNPNRRSGMNWRSPRPCDIRAGESARRVSRHDG